MNTMKKGYTTKVSTEILKYIEKEQENSFDTQDVVDYLMAHEIDANITTVYRNLEKLVENNTLVKFKTSKSASNLYRVIGKQHNCHRHLHLQCKMCGRIYHLNDDFMDQIDSYIKNEYQFIIDCQNTILMGICSDCSEK